MYTICKEFRFEAAHALVDLPESHPCHHVHGHSYRVQIEVEAHYLNAHGFVLDFAELDPFRRVVELNWRDGGLDHGNLNLQLPCATTSENIARYLYDRAHEVLGWVPAEEYGRHVEQDRRLRIVAVRVSETDKTWAEYRP